MRFISFFSFLSFYNYLVKKKESKFSLPGIKNLQRERDVRNVTLGDIWGGDSHVDAQRALARTYMERIKRGRNVYDNTRLLQKLDANIIF